MQSAKGSFKTYFVPEASVSLEYNSNGGTPDNPFHKETTKMIMRYFGEKIKYDNIMKSLSIGGNHESLISE